MDTFDVLFCIAILTTSCIGDDNISCGSPQYLTTGLAGIIQCSFDETFYGVVWYTSDGYKNKESLIRFIDGDKEGDGYSSGDFDILSNGSLLIRNVSLQQDQTFYVLKFESESDDNPIVHDVDVIVTVRSSETSPVVPGCENRNGTCFARVNHTAEVFCLVRGTKPAVSLTWVVRTADGDKNITTKESITTDGPLFTSNVTTSGIFPLSSLLSYLVCKANGEPNLILNDETAVLLESNEADFSLISPLTKYIENRSRMELICSGDTISIVVWRKLWERVGLFHILAMGALFDDGFSLTYAEGFELRNNGVLTVPKVNVKHEGLYGCVFQNHDNIGNMTLLDVQVYVPAYPTVDGCPKNQGCVLEVPKEGSLTCSVEGIRPKVRLELHTLFEEDSSLISFTDQEVTINNKTDTFDIFVTSKYHVNGFDFNKNTVHMVGLVCRIVQPDIEVMAAQTSFNLSVTFEEKPTPLQIGQVVGAVVGVTVGVAVVVAVITVVVWKIATSTCSRVVRKKSRKKNPQSSVENQEKEGLLMNPTNDTSLEAKRNAFIKQLKGKYGVLYNSVQPIPYIKEGQYSVNTVFVESGIENLTSQEGKEGHGTWQNLNSYRDILNEVVVTSSRCILEGDPGYGKSIITLQLAYDWCININPLTPNKIEILILLRLRQLDGIRSISKAIKRLILPRDSELSEADIIHIISNTEGTLIVLDGYDEYPDKDDASTDVNKIISKDMFQDAKVIVTTRPSYFLKNFAGMNKLRLSGFNNSARETYVTKVFTKGNMKTCEKIKQNLKDNPILEDICQIPLFFVMFAHLAQDNAETSVFTSVTSFFRHVISCLHGHMKNKPETENLSEVEILENSHHKLDKVAFTVLSEKVKQTMWEKEYLRKQIGTVAYDLYTRAGILVVEETLQVHDEPGIAMKNHIRCETKVRFYHKLFCEWYAAQFISRKLANFSGIKVKKVLQNLDPSDSHYVYRFACGLNPSAGRRIISYLRRTCDKKFTVLCILEQEGTETVEIVDAVKSLCSKTLHFKENSERILQRSTLQVLQIASRNLIPISVVMLSDCFSKVDPVYWNIELKSSLAIPVLKTLKVLVLHETGREMNEEETTNILHYSYLCEKLEVLRFEYCVLPQSIHGEILRSRDVEVSWFYGWSRHRLNLETGLWERVRDEAVMTTDKYENEMSKLRSSNAQKKQNP